MKVSLKEIVKTFIRVRSYERELSAQDYVLRWICRYHLFIKENDYGIIDQFTKPVSRASMVSLCSLCLRELYLVERVALIDSYEQYTAMRVFLHRLRAFCVHFPLLWWLCFHLPYRTVGSADFR